MEICENIEERKEQSEALLSLLSVRLPESYKRFLIESGSGKIYNLPIFGLPLSPEVDSVWGATEFLRSVRSDPKYLAVRFMDSRALCLDLNSGTSEDAPLVEINLTGTEKPKAVHRSFAQYLEEGRRNERRVEGALRRIKWHLEEARRRDRQYDHAKGGMLPRSHEFRVLRSCVHDQVVGLTAIHHNEALNGIEVDVFTSTDHPDYEEGHGVRALTLLILSDAYRNGATMAIHFTRYDGKIKDRVPDRIPPELLSLGLELGITFRQQEKGVITHDEAVQLFSAIVDLSNEVRKVVDHYQTMGRLTLQGLCYLLSTRLWTVEEVSWLLLNFHRPEGVLFGEYLPEDRLNYLESISYGRAVLLMTKLANRLKIDLQGNDKECFVQVNNLTWLFKSTYDLTLDWEVSGRRLNFTPNDIIEVLARPRIPLPKEEDRIFNDVENFLSRSNQKTKKFLLYSSDFLNLKNINEVAKQLEEKTEVGVLIAPFKCRELDQEVDRRMSRARVLRK